MDLHVEMTKTSFCKHLGPSTLQFMSLPITVITQNIHNNAETLLLLSSASDKTKEFWDGFYETNW